MPPHRSDFLAWFGLAPLLYSLRRGGYAAAALAGLLFGSLFMVGTFSWLNSLEIMNATKFAAWLGLFSLFYLVAGILYRFVSGAVGGWIILAGPAFWAAVEYVRANLFFFSLPWNFVGHSQYRHLLVIQVAGVAGVYGVSFVLVTVNQFLSQVPDWVFGSRSGGALRAGAVRGPGWAPQLLLLLLIVGGALTYGRIALETPEGGEHLRVAVVQANRLARDDMSFEEQKEHLRVYGKITRQAAAEKPDLVIWPSASLPGPYAQMAVRLLVGGTARAAGAHLLAGGAGLGKFSEPRPGYLPYANSEFLIAPSGKALGRYDKIKLLPFNEYVPLQGKITWPGWLTNLEKGFFPGEEYTIFRVKGAGFGTPICSENLVSDHFRRFVRKGADFMVSATNEGFMKGTGGHYQVLAMNVFRAVENRRSVVRAATTGVSAFIAPSGRIVSRVRDAGGRDLFVPGYGIWDMPLVKGQTFYTRHGDIFAFIACGVTVLLFLFSTGSAIRGRFSSRF